MIWFLFLFWNSPRRTQPYGRNGSLYLRVFIISGFGSKVCSSNLKVFHYLSLPSRTQSSFLSRGKTTSPKWDLSSFIPSSLEAKMAKKTGLNAKSVDCRSYFTLLSSWLLFPRLLFCSDVYGCRSLFLWTILSDSIELIPSPHTLLSSSEEGRVVFHSMSGEMIGEFLHTFDPSKKFAFEVDDKSRFENSVKRTYEILELEPPESIEHDPLIIVRLLESDGADEETECETSSTQSVSDDSIRPLSAATTVMEWKNTEY